jgi:hypothetical protein
MKRILAMLAVASTLCAGSALAGTPVLGFEVGVSTLDQVTDALSKKTQVEERGVNRYSNGPMLKTDGSSYGLEGLNSVVYIFDGQKKLMGVVMNMSKARFKPIYEVLSRKYKVLSQQRPFVGDQFARFASPDGIIELDAPHMSFEMEVSYLRGDLVQEIKEQVEAEKAAKKKNDAAQF